LTTPSAGGDVVAEFWPVQADRVIGPARTEQLYEVYLESFGILRSTAAARHVLTPEEFRDEMEDPRIIKYSVWRSATEPIALATVTTDLEAVTWVSPEFFVTRHPERAARKAIYYLGFAMVAPQRGQFRLLERVVRELVADCVADRGVLAYDVCAFNEVTIRFGRRAEAILRRVAPVRVGVADTQTYYEATFD
jgi:hypothetical protein